MDIRKATPAAAIVAAAFLSVISLYAGGYETFGLGARATSMGGAFIGLADDWTASYWNPAGLAQLKGGAVGIDLLTPHATLRASDSDHLRFGCEYKLQPTWALRAGFAYDESPLPAKAVSMAHIPDVDRKTITFGTGFQPADDWNIDLVGAVAWGDRDAREKSSNSGLGASVLTSPGTSELS